MQLCRVQSTDCDHRVLMDLFHLFFDILSLPLVCLLAACDSMHREKNSPPLNLCYEQDTLHVAFGARKTVCMSLVSVKKALGPDFEPHKEVSTTNFCFGMHHVIILHFYRCSS